MERVHSAAIQEVVIPENPLPEAVRRVVPSEFPIMSVV